jgi:hypothetical protein
MRGSTYRRPNLCRSRSVDKRIRDSLSDPVTRNMDAQVFHSANTASLPSDTRRALLIPSPHPCRRDRLSKVEFGFGVRELLRICDLQAPVFVGNDVDDED